jgi:hypothetical protein
VFGVGVVVLTEVHLELVDGSAGLVHYAELDAGRREALRPGAGAVDGEDERLGAFVVREIDGTFAVVVRVVVLFAVVAAPVVLIGVLGRFVVVPTSPLTTGTGSTRPASTGSPRS